MAHALRPATPDDEAFLFELYASTRAEEIAAWGWPPAQRDVFLRMQFLAQQRSYAAQFPGAEHRIILIDGARAGRLLVSREPGRRRLVDIALLPQHRGAGVGTALLRDLLAGAAACGEEVLLHVLKGNPAARLYERLGFVKVGETETHLAMACPAKRPA